MAEEGSTLNILAKSLQLVEKQIDSVTKSAAQLFSVAKGAGSTAASAVSVGVSNVMNLPPVRAGRLPGDTSGTVGGEPDGSNLMKKPHFTLPSFTFAEGAARAGGAVAGAVGIVALGSPSVKNAVQYRMVMNQAAFTMPGGGSLADRRGVADSLVKTIGKMGTGLSDQDLYMSLPVLRSGGIGPTFTAARSVAFMSNMNPGIGASEAAGLYNQLQSAHSTNTLMSYGINTRDSRGRPRSAAQIYEDYYQRIATTYQQRGGDLKNKKAFLQAINTSLLPGGAIALGTQNLFGDQAASVQNYLIQRAQTGKMNPTKKELEGVGLTTSDYNSTASRSGAQLKQLSDSADSLAAGFRTMNGILSEVDKGLGSLLKHIPGLGQVIGGSGTMMNSVLGGVAGGLIGRGMSSMGSRLIGGIAGRIAGGAATAATTTAAAAAAEGGAASVGLLSPIAPIAAAAVVGKVGMNVTNSRASKAEQKFAALLAAGKVEEAIASYKKLKSRVDRGGVGGAVSARVSGALGPVAHLFGGKTTLESDRHELEVRRQMLMDAGVMDDDGVMGGAVIGTNTPNAKSILKGLTPNANSVSMAAAAMGYKQQGGVAHRNVNGTNVLSDHATGHAVDIMVPPKSADGYKLANYFLSNKDQFGVKYIIWNNQFASGKTGWAWEPYSKHGPAANQKTATGRHEDHVHVSTTDAVGGNVSAAPTGQGTGQTGQATGVIRGLHQTVFGGSAGERLYGSGGASAPGTMSVGAATPSTSSYADMLTAAEKKYGLPAGLLYAQMQKESGGNPKAISKVGAMGLMQLMPGTAKSLGVSNPFDPSQSIEAGARYLASNLKKFGSVDLALAAYNAGPGSVEKYHGVPPFKETQNYVKEILSNWQKQTTSRSVGGWNIPQDEFARLHKGEMVLPANIADAFRQAIEGQRSASKSVKIEVVLTGTTEQQAMELVRIVKDQLGHDEVMSSIRRS